MRSSGSPRAAPVGGPTQSPFADSTRIKFLERSVAGLANNFSALPGTGFPPLRNGHRVAGCSAPRAKRGHCSCPASLVCSKASPHYPRYAEPTAAPSRLGCCGRVRMGGPGQSPECKTEGWVQDRGGQGARGVSPYGDKSSWASGSGGEGKGLGGTASLATQRQACLFSKGAFVVAGVASQRQTGPFA